MTDVNANSESKEHALEEQNEEQMRSPHNFEGCDHSTAPGLTILGYANPRNAYECLDAITKTGRLSRRLGFQMAII